MSFHPFTGPRIRKNANGEDYEPRLNPADVYVCFDADSRPLYVGCTSQTYVRFNGHGNKDWWTDVARIDVEHFEDRRDALAYERDLIGQLLPLHNVAGIPESVLTERREDVTDVWPIKDDPPPVLVGQVRKVES